MSETLREAEIICNARRLRDSMESESIVSLYAEDFDFMAEKNRLSIVGDRHILNGVAVKRGPEKKKSREQ